MSTFQNTCLPWMPMPRQACTFLPTCCVQLRYKRGAQQGKFTCKSGKKSVSREQWQVLCRFLPAVVRQDPRDRSSRGEVQWFSRTASELAFLCYVPDEAAEEVSFVFWPYSFQYGEQSATPAAGPRKAVPPHPASWGKGPPLIVSGQFKRFSQVRGTVSDGGPDN